MHVHVYSNVTVYFICNFELKYQRFMSDQIDNWSDIMSVSPKKVIICSGLLYWHWHHFQLGVPVPVLLGPYLWVLAPVERHYAPAILVQNRHFDWDFSLMLCLHLILIIITYMEFNNKTANRIMMPHAPAIGNYLILTLLGPRADISVYVKWR